jgi:hypothetical protein
LQNYRTKNNTPKGHFWLILSFNIYHCIPALTFKSKNYYFILQNCGHHVRENFQRFCKKSNWDMWMRHCHLFRQVKAKPTKTSLNLSCSFINFGGKKWHDFCNKWISWRTKKKEKSLSGSHKRKEIEKKSFKRSHSVLQMLRKLGNFNFYWFKQTAYSVYKRTDTFKIFWKRF